MNYIPEEVEEVEVEADRRRYMVVVSEDNVEVAARGIVMQAVS